LWAAVCCKVFAARCIVMVSWAVSKEVLNHFDLLATLAGDLVLGVLGKESLGKFTNEHMTCDCIA